MLKLIVVNLINRIFGLKITVEDLDSIIAFVKMLISAFQGQPAVTAFLKDVVRNGQEVHPTKLRVSLEDLQSEVLSYKGK